MQRAERRKFYEAVVEYAPLLETRFIMRSDVYAQQSPDGRYICVHRPLTRPLLHRHLLGEITLGAYLLNQDSQARFVVLDADNPDIWHQLIQLSAVLSEKQIPSYLEESRRGGHLWFFFEAPTHAALVRAFAHHLVETHSIPAIEIYPKQDVVGDGPGSLIRLPFGVHRVTDTRYGFIDTNYQWIAPTIREQLQILAQPATVSKALLETFIAPEIGVLEAKRAIVEYPPTATLSEQIKGSITVWEFVSQFVALTPRGRGLCPFHDDKLPSFAVHDKGNYWHCFSGCGGGSVIDFWMKWRTCDFTSAVRELAQMVL